MYREFTGKQGQPQIDLILKTVLINLFYSDTNEGSVSCFALKSFSRFALKETEKRNILYTLASLSETKTRSGIGYQC